MSRRPRKNPGWCVSELAAPVQTSPKAMVAAACPKRRSYSLWAMITGGAA